MAVEEADKVIAHYPERAGVGTAGAQLGQVALQGGLRLFDGLLQVLNDFVQHVVVMPRAGAFPARAYLATLASASETTK